MHLVNRQRAGIGGRVIDRQRQAHPGRGQVKGAHLRGVSHALIGGGGQELAAGREGHRAELKAAIGPGGGAVGADQRLAVKTVQADGEPGWHPAAGCAVRHRTGHHARPFRRDLVGRGINV